MPLKRDVLPRGVEISFPARLDAAWDHVAAHGSIFMRRAYLEVLRAAAPDGFHVRTALVHREGRPAMAVLAQSFPFGLGAIVRADPEKAGPRRRDRVLFEMGRRALLERESAVVLCGNLYSWGLDGVAFAPGEDRAALWPCVAAVLEQVRRERDLRSVRTVFAIKEVPEDVAPELGGLAANGFRSLGLETDMVLDLPEAWGSFEDYLKALNSKYRKAAQGIVRDVEQAGLAVELLGAGDAERHGARLHALYRQVWERAEVKGAPLPRDYLPALAARLGEDFRCVGVRRGEILVGFVTIVRDRRTAVAYIVGFDYETNCAAPVYLRLLLATIPEALALGCRRISFGSTALEPKARLGARPRPAAAWMKHGSRLLAPLLERVLPLAMHEAAPERSPFR